MAVYSKLSSTILINYLRDGGIFVPSVRLTLSTASIGFPGKSVISYCFINPISYGNITCGHGSRTQNNENFNLFICINRNEWVAIVKMNEINR